MFDKVSQAAEKLATNVSRRAFLGRLGQGALTTAGVVGAMLAFGGEARANRHAPHPSVCTTRGHVTGFVCSNYNGWICCPIGSSCCFYGYFQGYPRCC
jgi:hypothetical protein